jgi:hypothetical protein
MTRELTMQDKILYRALDKMVAIARQEFSSALRTRSGMSIEFATQ